MCMARLRVFEYPNIFEQAGAVSACFLRQLNRKTAAKTPCISKNAQARGCMVCLSSGKHTLKVLGQLFESASWVDFVQCLEQRVGLCVAQRFFNTGNKACAAF